MKTKPKRRWRNTVAALAVLVPVAVVVVYSSLQVSDYQCEVCITFDGRENCGKAAAQTEEDGLRAATDNACALLAGGVTDRLRCDRTQPTTAECRRVGE